ncbi:chemotaxis protein CheD [Alkalibacillus filiformis]|uniref:Probable chemoreceptor glutamine deamidase CheD n=1 Tax=Alkalibacillus filiformis TaxID=200990 RepID=A0ABU0DQL0_9BACI|nr:chemotaxis protein CheD [Alkalibacillus filiformis]MDQ0350645.1 chemotaxis protein CheD [Alkalibacillus filiformis]
MNQQVLEVVKVGIADFNIAKHPQTIMTAGLGSCVGLILYDNFSDIAGLIHVMLPDSTMARNKSFKEGKFADTGIKALIEQLEFKGVRKSSLKAKMAGGAQMFNVKSENEMMKIGFRNVEAVRKQLKQYNIPIVAEDVGGNRGRTVEFMIDESLLKIRTIQEGVTYI